MKHVFLLAFLSALVGVIIFGFLEALQMTISLFQGLPVLIYALPIAGLLQLFLERRYHLMEGAARGPWFFCATLWSHLFGASVGRESTAIQIGDSLAWIFMKFSKNSSLFLRQLYSKAGIAAGFSAAFGVPLAGTLYSLEHDFVFHSNSQESFLRRSFNHLRTLMICLGAAVLSDQICRKLGAQHILFPTLKIEQIGWQSYLYSVPVFIGLGLGYTWAFRKLTQVLHAVSWKTKVLVGSAALILVTAYINDIRLNNLGTEFFATCFSQSENPWSFVFKLSVTVISLLSGFRGGEFTPLLVSGALFGSAFAGLIGEEQIAIYSALGITSLLASRTRAPFTFTFFLFEIFGWEIALLSVPIHFGQFWLAKYASRLKLRAGKEVLR